jgi:hypothetical protein
MHSYTIQGENYAYSSEIYRTALPKGDEKLAGRPLTEAFRKWHHPASIMVMTPNVTHHIHVLPEGSRLSRRKLSRRKLSRRKLPWGHIYPNSVHTANGTRNKDGRDMA